MAEPLDYQYEYRDLVIGHGTPYVVEQCRGLLSPPSVRDSDVDRQDRHGSYRGHDLFSARVIDFEIGVLATTANEMEELLEDLRTAFGFSQADNMLVFQRPWLGERISWCRPRRLDIPSNYEVAHGLAKPVFQLKAADPLNYSYQESNVEDQIDAGQSSVTFDVGQNGNFEEGTAPVITITGPTVNPRITNNDTGRAVRVDVTLTAGEVLVLDAYERTVTIDDVDSYDIVRTDNEWWNLLPGLTSVTYTRTGTTGDSPIVVAYRDAYI